MLVRYFPHGRFLLGLPSNLVDCHTSCPSEILATYNRQNKSQKDALLAAYKILAKDGMKLEDF